MVWEAWRLRPQKENKEEGPRGVLQRYVQTCVATWKMTGLEKDGKKTAVKVQVPAKMLWEVMTSRNGRNGEDVVDHERISVRVEPGTVGAEYVEGAWVVERPTPRVGRPAILDRSVMVDTREVA